MKLYTTKEFAELSGVSIRTLKYWRKSGKLIPAVNNGKGKTFYSKEQIFIAKKILGANLKILGANFTKNQNSWVQISDNLTEKGVTKPNDEVSKFMEENKQLYPTKELVIATDKMKKNIFNPTKQSTARGIIEDKKSKIVTPLNIQFSAEKNNITAFDELVFDVCISEQFKGNKFTTPAIIHRAMGGSKTKITAKDKDKILSSVRKLATTFIDFDITETCKHFNYNDGIGIKYSGSLLPCEYITVSVNGWTDSAVIHFLRDSPLLNVAKIKNQFATCDISLLDVPNIRNTELVLSLKGYLLRWILQIIGSHKTRKKHFRGKGKDGKPFFQQATKLQKIIKLDTLFEQCGLSDADRFKQREARKTTCKIMNHFRSQNLISEWHFEKKDGRFYSIVFD